MSGNNRKALESVLTLEPSPKNPRNSEGDFIRLLDGRLLFVYSHYYGGGGDHGAAFLAGRVSLDEGKTWSREDQVILPDSEAGMNVMSVTLRRLKAGTIALFYLRKNATDCCVPMVRFSRDEMGSWSEAVPCVPDQEGYFVLNNDRVIQLSSGRLLLAVARHCRQGEPLGEYASIFVYASDDNGETWFRSGSVANPEEVILQEPGLLELKDGVLMLFMRTNARYQYVSYSLDGGSTWSPAKAGNLHSPCSPASLKRIPATGDILAVWNHNLHQDPPKDRTPLTTAISSDEGRSWHHRRNLYDDPWGWYCYTAITFTGNDVLLGHCAGDCRKGNGLSVTQVTRVSIDWFYCQDR